MKKRKHLREGRRLTDLEMNEMRENGVVKNDIVYYMPQLSVTVYKPPEMCTHKTTTIVSHGWILYVKNWTVQWECLVSTP